MIAIFDHVLMRLLAPNATCATLWDSKNNRWLPFEDQRKSLIASFTEAQTDYLLGNFEFLTQTLSAARDLMLLCGGVRYVHHITRQ